MMTRRKFHGAALFLSPAAFAVDALGQDSDTVAIRIRIDDSVRGILPPIVQENLSIEHDQSEAAKELVRRSPPTRAVPVLSIIVGAMALPIVFQMIKELLRETFYGGVVIDTRAQPPSVTSDPKIPANMVFVIDGSGKTSRFSNDQLSLDLLRRLLKAE
jgi:hypothetical protein